MKNGDIVMLVITRLFLKKLKLILTFLTPFYQHTFEVPLLLRHLINIDIILEDFLLQETIAIMVAAIKIYRSQESFKGIAIHEAIVRCCNGTCMLDKRVKPNICCKLIKRTSAYNFTSQIGQKALLLITVMLIKNICNNGTEHSIS